ncbi:MAG TPA: PEP-CTERM sorting domain-containing protein [Candidatus Acidoferrales bacterium]|nr:PEP-CTERM sorting domain-containing protein [Candidatus Acidoferrales bacterium]
MMRRILISFPLVVLFAFLSPTRAKADDIFTFTIGSNTTTWELPATLNVSSPNMVFSDGSGFELESVPLTENGVAQGLPGILDFFTSNAGGGFELHDSILLNEFGPQLYSGLESSPTFLPGTYTLYADSPSGPAGTLVIRSTPEPSSLLMSLAGLFLIGLLARKRMGTSTSPVA